MAGVEVPSARDIAVRDSHFPRRIGHGQHVLRALFAITDVLATTECDAQAAASVVVVLVKLTFGKFATPVFRTGRVMFTTSPEMRLDQVCLVAEEFRIRASGGGRRAAEADVIRDASEIGELTIHRLDSAMVARHRPTV